MKCTGPLKALLAAIAVASFPGSALATGGIYCTGAQDPQITFGVATGRLPILAVLSANAFDGETKYATRPEGDETAIAFGQGMSEPDRVAIDFTDPNVERIVLSLRVHTAEDGHDGHHGELTFGDGKPIPVNCEFE